MSKVLIVLAPYYRHIADALIAGATEVLEQAGATHEIIEVPGAFEIPAAIKFASRKNYDGYLALGCVIRGETTHYDYICAESARGLQDLALQDGLAIGYGILTVENEKQALVRAARDKKNKGGEAARACLAMIELKRRYLST
jgi:6,7-dimethyl-8-ribityllumazine synthase